MRIYLILFMLFAHIIDDFVLQGILAKMKQKSWWAEQTDKPLYKNDYLAALIIHSLSWATMIHLPAIFLYGADIATLVFISIPLNLTMHAIVDNLKANKLKINLIEDQLLRFIQIGVTAACIYSFYGV